MNPIENMWSEVKDTVQETWPDLPPRNRDALWTLVSDAWDEVASSQRYVRSLTESMPRRMRSVIDGRVVGLTAHQLLRLFAPKQIRG
jgi:hypothetical protein